ncbi:MAG: OadG family protein [Pseudomonadota bacterium]
MTPLMSAGVQLMLVGMGTVFFFLTVLVAATRVMSAMALRLAPVPDSPPESASVTPGPQSRHPTPDEIAAISAAIAAHRAARR